MTEHYAACRYTPNLCCLVPPSEPTYDGVGTLTSNKAYIKSTRDVSNPHECEFTEQSRRQSGAPMKLSTESSSSSRPSAEDVRRELERRKLEDREFYDGLRSLDGGNMQTYRFEIPRPLLDKLRHRIADVDPAKAEDVRPDVAGLLREIDDWMRMDPDDVRKRGHADVLIARCHTALKARDADRAEAERQLAEYRADAERYRWLRTNWHQGVKIVPLDDSWKRIEALDARIDAARGASTKEVDHG